MNGWTLLSRVFLVIIFSRTREIVEKEGNKRPVICTVFGELCSCKPYRSSGVHREIRPVSALCPTTFKTRQDHKRWPLAQPSTSTLRLEVCSQLVCISMKLICCLGPSTSSLPLPAVLTAPIRLDVVQQVHSTCSYLALCTKVLNIRREHCQEQEASIRCEREGWSPD